MSAQAQALEQNVSGSNNIFAASGNVYVTNQPTPIPLSEVQTRKDLYTLLNKVKTFWIEGVLEKSIHNVVLLDLGKEIQPEAIDHPWETILEVPDSVSRSLPRGTKIVDLFEQSNHGLLILGNPGSGKTITLLELARELIIRVENDNGLSQPIPVVFNLSTWNNSRLSLFDWLISELSIKYQIPKRISRVWLENHRLLFLLDGLDEVKSEFRAACVEAINNFETEYGLAGLVVCSRQEEYTNISVRLKLNAAIRLQPLTSDQVNEYLSASGSRLDGLRSIMTEDKSLLTLAESPLMLSVMSLAYQDVSAESLSEQRTDTVKERRRHLFNSYIQRMFKRKGQGKKPYDQNQTLKWLSWLAQNMIKHKQNVFLVEQMQPSWLPTRRSQWGYALISRIIVGESLLSPFAFLAFIAPIIMTLWLGIWGGLDGELFPGLEAGLRIGLPLGLLIFILFVFLPSFVVLPIFFILGLVDGLQFHRNQEPSAVETNSYRTNTLKVLGVGLFFTFYCGGIFILPASFIYRDLGTLIPANENVPMMVSQMMNASSSFWWTTLFLIGIIPGVFGAIVFGLRRINQMIARDIFTTEFIGWSWRKAIIGGGIGSIILIVLQIIMWPLGVMLGHTIDSFATIFSAPFYFKGLPLALLSYFLAGGLIGGLSKGIVKGKSTPNLGIRLSLRNSVIAGLIGIIGGTLAFLPSAIISMTTLADSALVEISNQWGIEIADYTSLSFGTSLRIGLIYSFFTSGILIGLGLAMWFGSRDVIHHYTLRFFLWRNDKTPRKYIDFLDHATEQIFLRKVGGGYIFIHRLMMEYFAELETSEF